MRGKRILSRRVTDNRPNGREDGGKGASPGSAWAEIGSPTGPGGLARTVVSHVRLAASQVRTSSALLVGRGLNRRESIADYRARGSGPFQPIHDPPVRYSGISMALIVSLFIASPDRKSTRL